MLPKIIRRRIKLMDCLVYGNMNILIKLDIQVRTREYKTMQNIYIHGKHVVKN